METLKRIWHDIVARSIVQELEVVRNKCGARGRTIQKLERTNKMLSDDIASLKTNNRSLEKRLEIDDPLARSIDSVRAHAAQQRIQDLEAQLRKNNIEPQ